MLSKQVYGKRYKSRRSSKRINCIKNKNNKIWRKTIFNMADGILTPCNVARSWHWFRQVTAPCNVALESWQWIHQVATQHPTMWYVALGWHAIEFAQMSAILEFHIWFRFRPHHRSRHVILHQSPKSLSKSNHPRQKKNDVMSISRWRISAIFGFMGPITGPLKSPDTTSYRSSVVFEKMAFLHFGERQTNKQTNRWTAPMH